METLLQLPPPGSGTSGNFEGYVYTYKNESNIETSETITELTYWNTKPATPTFKVNSEDATIIISDKISDDEGNNWYYGYTSILEGTNDTIFIDGKTLKRLQISFTKSNKIIGYLVTDGTGNQIKESEFKTITEYGRTGYQQKILDTYLSDAYNTLPGSYNFKTDLKTDFTETLPLLKDNGVNTAYAQVVRKYYAVDVVGNISDPLTLTYTYSNPTHQATDIHLIRSLDDIEASDAKSDITSAVNNGTLKLASIVDKEEGEDNKKRTTRFFNGDYLLLSCTLKNKASSTNNDTPAKVELIDIWGGTYAGEAVRGYADGDNVIIYPSEITNSEGRYYCYVAFRVGNKKNNKWDHTVFDNNDQYGGNQLYAKVYGKPTQKNSKGTESDSYLLNPASEINIRWKRDIEGPAVSNAYISTNNGTSRLWKYKASSDAVETVNDEENSSWTGKTNSYPRDFAIYLPITDITDGFKYTGASNSDIGLNKNDFITYSAVSQYKTVIGSGESAIDSGWKGFGNTESINWNNTDKVCYKIQLPNVELVHNEITLYIRDSVGNESIAYKIAKSDAASSLWWIVNDLFTKKTNAEGKLVDADAPTITAPTFDPNANDYTFEIMPPDGSIIKSVTAKVNGTDVAVAKVTFNGYVSTKASPTLNGTQGYLNLSGLKVKLNKISQKWFAQNVQIIINGDDNKAVTVEKFVPAFTLTKDYIETQAATWELNKRSGYEVFVTVKNGPTADNITSIAANNAKVDTWTVVEGTDNKTVKVTLKDVVAQDWGKEQNVTLKINDSNDSFDTDPVLTVPQIAPDHIGINALTWDDGTDVEGQEGFRKFTAELTIPDGASAVTGLSVSNATLISSNIASSPVKAEFKANKGWTQKPIRLQITGDTNNGSSTSSVTVAKEVLKLDELTKEDLSITVTPNGYVKGTTEYELTVNVPANVAIPDNTETATYISAGNATIAKLSEDSVNKYKLTVAPDWDEKPVTVKVQNFEPFPIFTIDAIAKDDIEIKQNGSTPEYVAGSNVYVLTISVPGNATLNAEDIVVSTSTTEVGKCSASGSWNPGSKEYTLNVTPGWEKQKVYLNIKQLGDIEVFEVAKRPFTSEDFELGNASPVAGEEGKYTIPVNLKNGAPASEITNVTGDYGEKASWNEGSKTVTVDNLPSATWNDQTITLTFNADAEGKNGIDKVTDVIVPAKPLQATNITLGSASKQDDGSYTIDVTFGENVPATALKKVATDMDAITGVFEKISAEGETPETGTITLSGVPEASWTDEYKIKLVINEGAAQFTIEEPVIVIEKKVLKATDVTIDKGTSTVNYASVTITLPDEVTLNDVKYIGTGTVDVTNAEWNSKIWILQPKDGATISTGEVLELDTSNGKVNITLFEAPSNPEGNGSQSNDAGNAGSRAGFFSGLISRITGASSESSYTPVETDKTRSITIPNWTTDDLNSSDVADKVNESSSAVTKKAAKKAKKAQKAAKSVKTPVEQPIASETVESVAVTSAATLGDVVETVTETAAEVITSADTTETSVIADTVEPSATMNLPVYSEPLAEEEMNASDSRALIWTFIALITAALVTVAAVLLAKRRK